MIATDMLALREGGDGGRGRLVRLPVLMVKTAPPPVNWSRCWKVRTGGDIHAVPIPARIIITLDALVVFDGRADGGRQTRARHSSTMDAKGRLKQALSTALRGVKAN